MDTRKRKILSVLAVLLAVAAVFISSSLTFRNPGAGTNAFSQDTSGKAAGSETDIRSAMFENKEDKLQFLSGCLDMPSSVMDAEYHIAYGVDPAGDASGRAGPDIRAALKVAEADLPLWSKGMKRILPQQADLDWWEDLKTSELTWLVQYRAEYYKDPDSSSYVVIFPENQIVLKRVTAADISETPEALHDIEELPGYDDLKILAADKLEYDASTLPFIKTVLAEKLPTEKGREVTVIYYKAMYLDSPAAGIPVLVISREEDALCEVLLEEGFSYWEECHLADVDGDGAEEILMQLCTGYTGGAGAYQTDIYRLTDSGLDKIFSNPEWESNTGFDTGFTLHLSEGSTCTVENIYTDFKTSFTHSHGDDYPYFDEEGSLTDEGRKYNTIGRLGVDPYFHQFLPVDTDGDGVSEILAAQFTYLWSRADGLGAAYTILKWDDDAMSVSKAGFLSYEASPEQPESQTRWEDYESSWYKTEEERPEADAESIAKAVSRKIADMDFTVKTYPLDEAFNGSETDRAYRDAYYKAITNQTPVLHRRLGSQPYKEISYKKILGEDFLDDREFLEQSLRQSSGFYYMDYDGDGFPELIHDNQGLYGLKYNPEDGQVYLFLNMPGGYANLMGAGQIYCHNPCIANKEMYAYEAEDQNGNRQYADFMVISGTAGGQKEAYYVSAGDFQDVQVSRDTWDKLLGPLQAACGRAPAPVSFDELFGLSNTG